MTHTKALRVVLDVEFELDGETIEDMQSLLERHLQHAIGNGLLTGSTGAQVEEFTLTVTPSSEKPDEDEIADFMLRRIENGDLPVEDIPSRLARYGIMDSVAFRTEMQERMALAEAEAGADADADAGNTGGAQE